MGSKIIGIKLNPEGTQLAVLFERKIKIFKANNFKNPESEYDIS